MVTAWGEGMFGRRRMKPGTDVKTRAQPAEAQKETAIASGKKNRRAQFELPVARATKQPIVEYAGTPVPAEKVSWEVIWKEYKPKYYVDQAVLQDPKKESGERPDWAESEDFKERLATGEPFRSFSGPIRYDADGKPLNPTGRTGRAGRGLLGKWGANFAADNIITTTFDDGDYVLLIGREDGQLGFPAGMVDFGERPRMAAKREFMEEVGDDLDLSGADVVYRGYVDDPRNRDNAWMETTAMHQHVSAEVAKKMKSQIMEPEAITKAASWYEITPELKASLYASHGEILDYVPLELARLPKVEGARRSYTEGDAVPKAELLPVVGLFGTAGASTWRSEFKKLYGASDETFFNPQKEQGQWKPEDAAAEAENLAKDKVIVFAITKDTEGYGSLVEVGFAILGAILRGQKVGIFVEESGSFNKDAQRARNLIKDLFNRFQDIEDSVKFFSDLPSMAVWAKQAMGEEVRPPAIPDVSHTLAPTILLTGSSGSIDGAPSLVRAEVKNLLSSAPFVDTHVSGPYSRIEAEREANLKQKAAVILHTITDETEGLGCLAEVATLAATAFANGQTLCVYMEPHLSDRKSNANKSRAIVRRSMEELLKLYPGIVYFIEGKAGEITEEDRSAGLVSRAEALGQITNFAKMQLSSYVVPAGR